MGEEQGLKVLALGCGVPGSAFTASCPCVLSARRVPEKNVGCVSQFCVDVASRLLNVGVLIFFFAS